jgi:flagellar biosynthesis/type III secretory pathway M-ring protein FliF/YscJ
MKNNEWNVPSDYFEKNKKALMPVRKFPTGKWILALAAACVIGVGFFLWSVSAETSVVAKVQEKNEKQNEVNKEKQNENENEGKRGEEKVIEDEKGEDIGSKNLSTKEDIAEGLKEIPREELVAYLLEQDSELIENLN